MCDVLGTESFQNSGKQFGSSFPPPWLCGDKEEEGPLGLSPSHLGGLVPSGSGPAGDGDAYTDMWERKLAGKRTS